MKSTYLILTRKDQINKDKTKSVYLRVICQRKIKYFSLNVRVLEKNFNSNPIDYKYIKHNDTDHYYKNSIIKETILKVQKIFLDFDNMESKLSIETFTKEYLNYSSDFSFFTFVESEIDKRFTSEQTIRTYKTQLSKLKRFKPELSFKNIDFDFVQSYKQFMINNLDNKLNTWNKSLGMLKTFVNWGIDKNLINENPFDKIKIQKVNGNRQYLTLNELQFIEKLLNDNVLSQKSTEILKYFLFSCYTGLRFTDIKNLAKKNFYTETNENHENYFISVDMHKTNRAVNILVIPKAFNLIKDFDKKLSNEKIFKVRCNQVTNRRLKEIIKKTDIKKSISFHCARHTFATVGLEVGMPIEIIKNVCGHTKIETTLIYAKITKSNMYKQMMKLN